MPGIRDRIVQEALRMILEPIWEADFSQRSYGFRPNRSTYDAISYLSTRLASYTASTYQWVIEGDIVGCFDNIPHDGLLRAVARRIADGKVLSLVSAFLKAGYMENWQFHNTYSGTPQGGIASPLLSDNSTLLDVS